jgi:hypothetical protein
MAYERAGTGPWAWLKSVGTQEDPLDLAWPYGEMHLLDRVFFSKHPRSIRAGDVLVYYAAGRQVLPALMLVTSDEVHDEGEDVPRWRYWMSVRPIIILSLRGAPTLTQAGISPTSVRRQSHVLLSPEQYVHLRELMLHAVNVTLGSVEGAQPQAA